MQRILGNLSMRCFEFCELAHHGAICRPITATGTMSIAVFAAGEIRGYGKNCLKS
jgi:hypothetical protein